MSEHSALMGVLAQLQAAKPELDAYDPPVCDWYQRACRTVGELVPWLAREAAGLRSHTECVLNSPCDLRKAWQRAREAVPDATLVATIDQKLREELILLDFIAGDTISSVVTKYLIERYLDQKLAGNSKSDYPDLYLVDRDYSGLPARRRAGEGAIGAAVRGPQRKPVRVPDGLEIKTSRNGAAIDCHFPHPGLHLMLSFHTTAGAVRVDDVLVAYLKAGDYRVARRSTEATTVKASFTRASFISLIQQGSA